MISIIVSSINTEQNLLFVKNIERTIGVPYELLIHDNRISKWGLCKLYNHYARISKYDILCFFHEDICFHTLNWGTIISDFFYQTPQAGVVGFAGSTIKTKHISGWGSHKDTCRRNVIQHFRNGDVQDMACNPLREAYSPVVVIDGLALITTKKVWEQCPFDELNFPGFHLYDLDFSMQTAQYYTNYVCHTIQVEHFSSGSYTTEWFDKSQVFHQKWFDKLPLSTISYTELFVKKCEDVCAYQMAKGELKYLWKQHSLNSMIKKHQDLDPLLYKLKLIKYILKAGSKKISYKLRFHR